MLKKIKHIFIKKPLVICIHGFGRRRSAEYDNFILWGGEDYEFITFDIYDDNDENDTNFELWIARCEEQVEKLLPQERDIYIIGFSMGGVIATHLASKYDAKKLFLIAPAFEFVSLKTVIDTVIKKINSSSDSKATPSLSSKHVSSFMSVIDTCKDSVYKVSCPTLIVHGDADEVIPLRSSINAYNRLPSEEKQLFFIHEGVHRLMLDEKTNNEIFQLFEMFMNDKIVTNHPPQAADPYAKEKVIEDIIIENVENEKNKQ